LDCHAARRSRIHRASRSRKPFGRVRGPIEPGEVVETVVTSFQPPIVPWETFTVKVQEFVAP
jgi:hypothetical protein